MPLLELRILNRHAVRFRAATGKHWAKYMRGRYTISMLCAAVCILASAGLAGCTCVTHRQAAKPVSATLQIEVEGQWRTVQRTVYEYPENDDERNPD